MTIAFLRSAVNSTLSRRSDLAALLLRKLSAVFAVNIAGTVIAFGLQVMLARLLGVDNFGQYVYALTWINLSLFVAKLGFDTASLRFIPQLQSQERWGLLRGFIRRSKQMTAATSVLTASIVAAVVVSLNGHISAALKSVFLLACILLPVSAYLAIQGAHLRAFKCIVAAQAPQAILKPMLMVIGVVILFMSTKGHNSADMAMCLNIGASLAAVSVMVWLSRVMFPEQLKRYRPEFESLRWSKVALSMTFITSFTMVLNQTDLVMVGGLVSTTDAGIYSAASRIAMFLTFGVTMANTIAAPMISEFYSKRDLSELQRMLSLVAWGSFAFATPLCVGIIIFSKQIMHVFGAEFGAGAGALVVLTVSRWFNAVTGSAGYLMSMSGHERQAAWILGASTAVNLVLNALLIPLFGMMGAAVATLVTTILWGALMVFYGKKYVGVNPTVSFRIS